MAFGVLAPGTPEDPFTPNEINHAALIIAADDGGYLMRHWHRESGESDDELRRRVRHECGNGSALYLPQFYE